MITVALFQPDIPQNLGAMIRLCACVGAGLEIIEPCGFIWDERKIRQSAMDYFDKTKIIKHMSWNHFLDLYQGQRRIILMTTKTDQYYNNFTFQDGDILLAGRESAGVPQDIHSALEHHLGIPMQDGFRSLNIVNATSMILGEAMRQTQWNH